MWEVLKALREGAAIGASEEMLCLVYAFQALVHQRFVLQGTAGGVSVGIFWRLPARLDQSASPTRSSHDTTRPRRHPPSVTAQFHLLRLVLLSLWRRTLISKDFASLDESADRFVRHLWETSPDLMQSPLTDLQRRVFDSAINPFHSESHVILSAPTNSGKSTAAEMFLIAPTFLNRDRRCSIYIAPTRASLKRSSVISSVSFPMTRRFSSEHSIDWRGQRL